MTPRQNNIIQRMIAGETFHLKYTPRIRTSELIQLLDLKFNVQWGIAGSRSQCWIADEHRQDAAILLKELAKEETSKTP